MLQQQSQLLAALVARHHSDQDPAGPNANPVPAVLDIVLLPLPENLAAPKDKTLYKRFESSILLPLRVL